MSNYQAKTSPISSGPCNRNSITITVYERAEFAASTLFSGINPTYSLDKSIVAVAKNCFISGALFAVNNKLTNI